MLVSNKLIDSHKLMNHGEQQYFLCQPSCFQLHRKMDDITCMNVYRIIHTQVHMYSA